jgi:hypothetical protein
LDLDEARIQEAEASLKKAFNRSDLNEFIFQRKAE